MRNAIRREEAICKELMFFVLVVFLHLGPSSSRAEDEILLFIFYSVWVWQKNHYRSNMGHFISVYLTMINSHIAACHRSQNKWFPGGQGVWRTDGCLICSFKSSLGQESLSWKMSVYCLEWNELMGLSLHIDTSKMTCPWSRKIAHYCVCLFASAANSWWLWFFPPCSHFHVWFADTFLQAKINKALFRSETHPHPTKSLQLQQLLIVTIDLGKSISCILPVCVSVCRLRLFLFLCGINYLFILRCRVWHVLLKHRSKGTATMDWIKNIPQMQDFVTRKASSRRFREHCRNALS